MVVNKIRRMIYKFEAFHIILYGDQNCRIEAVTSQAKK
jgi:hypothetical protein